MPITLKLANIAATDWRIPKAESVKYLFRDANREVLSHPTLILHSSLNEEQLQENHTSWSSNGFIWSAVYAYSHHHHLTIRPEGVWFAILTQLGFFVKANAEGLRSVFVAHEDRRELKYVAPLHRGFENVVERLADMLFANMKDPELRDWATPSFSTTTETDVAVASVLLIGAMQNYFSFKYRTLCGISSITLLGEVADWSDILSRLDKLDEFGSEPRRFAEILRPIIENIILSFRDPHNPSVLQFWNTIAHKETLASGEDSLSGWITAFCYWDEAGKAHDSITKSNAGIEKDSYPKIDMAHIASGFSCLPLGIDDAGEVIQCTILAGSVAIQASEAELSDTTEVDISRGDSEHPEKMLDDESPTSSHFCCPALLNELFSRKRQPRQPRKAITTPGKCLNAIQPVTGFWVFKNETAQDKKIREEQKEAVEAEIQNLRAMKSGTSEAQYEQLLDLYQLHADLR